MKYKFEVILQYTPWLLLLLGIDVFASLLLWIADAQAFHSMIIVILLATLLFFFTVCRVLMHLDRKRKQAFSDFLENPDEYHEALLLKSVTPSQRESLSALGTFLRDHQDTCANLHTQLSAYEEYVESWAHETKTPLSLLTFLLDNHSDELPASIGFKLDYIRNHMQESIDHMLFYARLTGTRKDYLFEWISIRTCIEDVLEDYKPLLDEKDFCVHICLSGRPLSSASSESDTSSFSVHKDNDMSFSASVHNDIVYSDRRGLHFLLGQIISNAVKYCSERPELYFESATQDSLYVLYIKDNGSGVRSCDMPYIFEKGFTGDSGDGRKRATGMGLYLAKEMARQLNINLDAHSEWGRGFEMQIAFPIVAGKPI